MKFKRLSESVNNNDTLLSEYRKYANLDEDFEITEDNLDDWALNSAAIKCNIPKADAKHRILGEDITLDQAAREMEASKVIEGDSSLIEITLDESLKKAKYKQRYGENSDFPNVLIVSEPGMGKTSIIRQWAAKNNVHLVYQTLSTMSPEMLGGIVGRDADDPDWASRLASKELIQSLDKPNTVLFLDEYNRSKKEIRGAFLTVIQDHIVDDPKDESKKRFLPNFLFTIAAMNPSTTSTNIGAHKVEPAEKSRFEILHISPSVLQQLKYLREFYSNRMKKDIEFGDEKARLENQGRLQLAETILSYPDFSYDTSADVEDNSDDEYYTVLNQRSFKLALDKSDGTKESLLRLWDRFCNYNKKPIIERALKNYQDVDDKANAALKGGTESDVFKKRDAEWVKQQLRGQGININ